MIVAVHQVLLNCMIFIDGRSLWCLSGTWLCDCLWSLGLQVLMIKSIGLMTPTVDRRCWSLLSIRLCQISRNVLALLTNNLDPYRWALYFKRISNSRFCNQPWEDLSSIFHPWCHCLLSGSIILESTLLLTFGGFNNASELLLSPFYSHGTTGVEKTSRCRLNGVCMHGPVYT